MRRFIRTLWIVLAALALLLSVGPFLIPVPPLEGLVSPESLADPDSRFAEIGGWTVHYKISGEGVPGFILLHGFGSGVYTWHAVMEPLARFGTALAYDRPAFGLTERPLSWQGRSPYGPEANAELLLELMDQFGTERAILIGNSAGGTLALNFALAHPDRVSALILVDPAVYTGGPPTWLAPLLTLPQVRHLGPLIVRRIRDSGPEFLRTAWHDPAKITPDTIAAYEKPLRVQNWDTALWDFTVAGHDTGIASHLNELTLPILVITGDDDRIVPTSQSIRLAGELPSATLSVIGEAGHVPQEEQPEGFLRAVKIFIESLPGDFSAGVPH